MKTFLLISTIGRNYIQEVMEDIVTVASVTSMARVTGVYDIIVELDGIYDEIVVKRKNIKAISHVNIILALDKVEN